MGIIIIILIVIVIAILILTIKYRKKFKLDSITMINGAVGVGKTSTGLYLAHKLYKKEMFRWNLRRIFLKKEEEKPLLYSNIPLFKWEYTPLNIELILRNQIRFNYRSVIFIDESSLIADSQDYKKFNELKKNSKQTIDINTTLNLFLLFFRHETRGGHLIITTQSKNDNHYAFDRKCSSSLFLTKSINIPFFKVVWARELLLMDSNVVNVVDDDYKESVNNYWYLMSKRIFKHYDSYCYSILTDHYKSKNDTLLNKEKTKNKKRFEIITLHTDYEEINNNNELYRKENNNG